MFGQFKLKLNSMQIIAGSFIIAILVGAFFLMLPISSNNGKSTDLLTCLFTSTSAMCVTGLVLVDTASHWSFFGQLVILILIQIGGMGVLMAASLITIMFGQKINIKYRTTLQEALSVKRVGGIIKFVQRIIRSVLYIELIGAILLFISFIKDFNILESIWKSIFHSISAFCNAGFDIMGLEENYISLTNYRSDIIVNFVIMSLIIFGGLGFTVLTDIRNKKLKFKRCNLQTKIVLTTTIVLIIIPAICFYIFEFSGFDTLPRVLSSLFQSVTTRTAGFNTIDFADMSEVGKAISIILMLIGGSPGSTAGGMKTTTIAVLIVSAIAVYKRNSEAHIFNRRIEVKIVRNAITIFMLYLSLFLVFGFIICMVENIKLIDSLFVTASALGTVGLSTFMTGNLSTVSKVMIIILMYLGRVGGFTFIYAVVPSINTEAGYIAEDVTVG